MAEDKILTATEASRAFSDLLHRVCYGGESFVIKKGQRLMARITPVGEAEEKPVLKTEEKTEKPDAGLIEMFNLEALNVTGQDDEYYKAVIEGMRKPVSVLSD